MSRSRWRRAALGVFSRTWAPLLVGTGLGVVAMALLDRGDPLPRAWASATHGSDNFAIATGLVDDELEALYFLDYLTGDLRATIISRRNGAFTGFFEHNVLEDFDGIGETPRFLMVTGLANLPRGGGQAQLGRSLVYVAEATSGQVFAYALPFSSTLNAAGQPQRGGFRRIGGGSFRDTFVRDPD